GGWTDEDNRTWEVVAPLIRAMARTQLDGGRDVVVPQYHARPEEISALEDLARAQGAASARSSCSTSAARRSSGSAGAPAMTTTRTSSTCTTTSGRAAAPPDSGRCTTPC